MYLILAIFVTHLGMQVSLTDAEAGLRITVTESTLQKVNEADLQDLRNHLNGLRFYDISGKFAETSWKISNIHISYVGTFTPDISLQNGGLIMWTCFIHRLILNANWRARQNFLFGPISAGGSVETTVDGISIQTNLTLSETSGGLAIILGNCETQVNWLSVHFSRGDPLWDLVLNVLSDLFRNDFKSLVSPEICRHVKQGMRVLTTDMKHIQVSFPIMVLGFPLTLDNSFTKVTVSNNKISTYHKGAIQWKDKTFNTLDSSPFPSVKTNFGIAFDVKEDVFNNLLQAIVATGLLDGIISYSSVMQSKWQELYLKCEPSTFCLGNILMTTAAQYPGRVVGMRWSIESVNMSIRHGKIVGEVRGRVHFSADSKTESMPLFSANIDLGVAFQMKFSSGRLSCRAVALGGNVTIDRSSIGKVLTPPIAAVINLLFLPGFKEELLRLINAQDTDYPLQLPRNVNFQSSRLMLYEGVVRIETDLCYRTDLCHHVTSNEWVGSRNIGNFSVNDFIEITTTTTSTTTEPSTSTTTTTCNASTSTTKTTTSTAQTTTKTTTPTPTSTTTEPSTSTTTTTANASTFTTKTTTSAAQTTTTTSKPTPTSTTTKTSTFTASTTSNAIAAGKNSTVSISFELQQTVNNTNASVQIRFASSIVKLLCYFAAVFAITI